MPNWKPNKKLFFFIAGAVLAAGILAIQSPASAAVGGPRILNYQGKLFDENGTLLGGAGADYCFRFSFYDDPTPGGPDTRLWPAVTSSVMTITVTNGVFSANIGDTSAGGDALTFNFQDTDSAYLNVEVAEKIDALCTGPSQIFETLNPRQRIVSAGYAINALTVGGFAASQNATGSAIPVLSSGNLVLGGTDPQINATGTNTLTLQGGTGTGNIQFFNNSNFLSSTGTFAVAGTVSALNINQFLRTTSTPTFSGLILSNLSTGNLLFAGGSGVLSTSTSLFWDTSISRLGVGTNQPSSTLHVVGGTTLQGFTFTNATGTGNMHAATLTATGLADLQDITFANATGTTLSLSASGTVPLTVTQSGNTHFIQFFNGLGIEQFRVDANGSVFANGFIAKQMQFSEEFTRTNTAVVNDTAGGGTTGLGDTFSWGVGSTANGHVSIAPAADAPNGVMQLRVTGGTGRAGLLYLSAGSGNRNDILNATSSPVIVMKLRPTAVGTGNLLFAGMADFTDGVTTDPTNGIYFTNASGTTWVGVARSSNSQRSVTCTGQTVSTTNFAYFRIQVTSTSSVEFFMDNDTSDGIDTVSCGRVTSTIPTSAMTAEVMNQIRTGGTQPADVLIDYIRLNQDDPVASGDGTLNLDPDAGADLAEHIGALDPEITEAGDVVALTPGLRAIVRRSDSPSDPTLYGVISTDPGTLLAHATSNSVRIALAGRVPVKANLRNGAIAVGDWLTSSEEPGIAMKAVAPGMVLGRALEPYDGTGPNKILASVEVQYFSGSAFSKLTSLTASVTDAAAELFIAGSRNISNWISLTVDKLIAPIAFIGELFTKNISVLPDGTLTVPAGQNQMSGRGVIPGGQSGVFIHNTRVTSSSKIFVTPAVALDSPLAVTEKTDESGFEVRLARFTPVEVPFDWILINTYSTQTEETPRNPMSVPVNPSPAPVLTAEPPSVPEIPVAPIEPIPPAEATSSPVLPPEVSTSTSSAGSLSENASSSTPANPSSTAPDDITEDAEPPAPASIEPAVPPEVASAPAETETTPPPPPESPPAEPASAL